MPTGPQRIATLVHLTFAVTLSLCPLRAIIGKLGCIDNLVHRRL